MLLPLSYSWRNLLARKGSTLVTVVGVAVSVMVYVVITATADGIARVATATGSPDNLIVLSKGANSEDSSRLDRSSVAIIRSLPGVARDARGRTLASPELLLAHAVPKKGSQAEEFGASRYTSVRGVTPLALAVHPGVRVVEGRFPGRPGEVMIGRLLPSELGAVTLGDTLRFGGRRHEVVGLFEARGQIFEGEIWLDLGHLQNDIDRRDVSSVVLRLADARRMPAVLDFIESSKRVGVEVKPEPEYYADIQRASGAFVYLGNLIGLLMGVGAVVTGMNTLYAAMSRRVREMGTLRALGFGRRNVGAALLLESVLLGLVGGGVGLALAVAFDGYAMNLVGFAFELQVEGGTVARGAALALGIGLLGGLLPARAASRLEIVEALRHL